jgi:hypothetical protein
MIATVRHTKEKVGSKLNLRPRSFAYALAGLFIFAEGSQAATADWLAVDLSATVQERGPEDSSGATAEKLSDQLSDQLSDKLSDRINVLRYFDDEVAQATTVTQNIRILKKEATTNSLARLADTMIVDKEIGAEEWLSKIPAVQPIVDSNPKVKYDCYLDASLSRVSCDDTASLYIGTGTSDQAPKSALYADSLVAQFARQAGQPSQDHLDASAVGKEASDVAIVAPSTTAPTASVVLIPRRDGLVTVAGKHINFSAENQSMKVSLDKKLQRIELSLFVRDPAIVAWDEKTGVLTGKKAGHTEVFVVTPGRISIIEASVEAEKSKPEVTPSNAVSPNLAGTRAIQLPTSLASLDGLDYAASKGSMAASNSGSLTEAPNLDVADEVSKLGHQGLSQGSQFIRAKAKARFESLRLKIVDDRSVIGGANYPVGGVRVKVAGTEFSQLTNGQGEVEIHDVPTGARLLLDISDERGYLMPQLTEIVAERNGRSEASPQIVTVLRFVALDLTARSVGVVQDMQKSSFCGVVTNRRVMAPGVRVSLDTAATGPIYFNRLGLPDLTLGGTGPGGRFCFFNVEPGPVAMALRTKTSSEPLSGVVGLVSGRHAEETFDLGEASHVSTTLTTIATANEQLGSDVARSSRHDLVEMADIYAVGSGKLMVPVDEGVMTTATAVLPVKGRIWAVSASPDFETSVQAVPVRATSAKQITTLIPNGFVSDMSTLSQTSHNSDEGSVIVEHGNLSGQGTDPVKIRLVDAFGRDVGDGWYFADQPVSKAIFFNVPAGIYALIVETATGHWLAADTVIVYSESVSVAKTGGQLEKISTSTQQAFNN